jgi:hypothetical protein
MRSTGVELVAVAMLVAGCVGGSAGEPLRTITRVDVVDLPAGTATGTTYSGNYIIDTMFVSGCHCRVGLCSYFGASPFPEFSMLQQDGMLTVHDFVGVATGWIDADGSYAIGSAVEDDYGASYGLDEGKIGLVDGVPHSGRATLSMTVTGDFGMNLDCDVRLSETFHYVGPL